MNYEFIGLAVTLAAGIYAIYQATKYEIATIREQITQMNNHHREDMRSMDDRIIRIDEKWERLFEKLLLQDKAKI